MECVGFDEALTALDNGKKIALDYWGGYWYKKNGQIFIHTKDGEDFDLRDTKDIFYTLRFTTSKRWIIF